LGCLFNRARLDIRVATVQKKNFKILLLCWRSLVNFFAPFRSLTARQRHAFAACFLGWSLDAFDYFILVFCVSAIATDFAVARSAVTEALVLTLAFRPLGALLFGWMADRIGRRPTLIINILCYSVLELACAFTPSLHVLLILRALFGIAMGGEWGVGAALAFETLPKENRGFFSGLLQEGYQVGYLLAALAFFALFNYIGWRGMFIVGAAPALLAGYIGWKVEESSVWQQGRAARGGGMSLSGLWQGVRSYTPLFLFLVLLMSGFNSFSHGSQDLHPVFLQSDHHFATHTVGAIGFMLALGAISGGITFGSLSERWGRKRAIITAALLAIPVTPLAMFSHGRIALACGAFLLQFMVQGAWGVIPVYLNEISPGPVRATFPGVVYQLGNLIASEVPAIQARTAERIGSYGMVLAVTTIAVALFIAIVMSFARESRGAEITA
jgi:SHS family lactate transporter-like MFS transporter